VTGAIAAQGNTATLYPSHGLASQTTYTAVVSTQVSDNAGNTLAQPFTWTFTTAQFVDTTPPTVSWTTPANGDSNVGINVQPKVQFSEAIDPNTVTGSNLFVSGVTASLYASADSVQLVPSAVLAPSTSYSLFIGTGIKDTAGNALAAAQIVTFTTAAVVGGGGSSGGGSGSGTCAVDTDCDPGCATGLYVCDITLFDTVGVCRDRCTEVLGTTVLSCPDASQVCTEASNPSQSGFPAGYCGVSPFGGFGYCQ